MAFDVDQTVDGVRTLGFNDVDLGSGAAAIDEIFDSGDATYIEVSWVRKSGSATDPVLGIDFSHTRRPGAAAAWKNIFLSEFGTSAGPAVTIALNIGKSARSAAMSGTSGAAGNDAWTRLPRRCQLRLEVALSLSATCTGDLYLLLY